MRQIRACASTICIALTTAAGAGVSSFHWIDPLPGHNRTRSLVLSGDGNTVTAVSLGTASNLSPTFVWRENSAPWVLPSPLDAESITVRTMNFDASVIAGTASINGTTQPFMWTPSGGAQYLSVPPGSPSATVNDVSPDGRFMAGTSVFDPVIWADGVASYIAKPQTSTRASLHGINADGTAAVGKANFNGVNGGPFVWTAGGGSQWLEMIGAERHGDAVAISPDGRFIVGNIGFSASMATRWKDGDIETLGSLPGFTTSDAFDVSADGSIVVGESGPVTKRRGFVWIEDRGMMDVNDLVTASGVDIGDGRLIAVTHISDDGLTIGGIGSFVNADGTTHDRAWVTHIPAPSHATLVVIACTAFNRRRR